MCDKLRRTCLGGYDCGLFEKLSFLLVNKTEENHETIQSIVTIKRLEPEIFPYMKHGYTATKIFYHRNVKNALFKMGH
jgi:hypothetical protein